MATVWKGALSFGVLHIPVHAEPAVRDREGVSFRQLDKANNAPIKMKRVNSVTGKEVAWKDLVKGYEYTKGRFVVITQSELNALKVPTGRALELLSFVNADEIDPRHYETPYFLVPEPTASRAYALLREAIRDTGVVGVGRVTMRQRTHIVAVRVIENVIVMDVLRSSAELVDLDSVKVPSAEGVKQQEKAMAQQLIEMLRAPFDPADFTDDYTAAVKHLVEAKLEGVELPTGEAEEIVGTPVIDLMDRLRESLAAATNAAPKGARTVSGDDEAAEEQEPKHGRATKSRRAAASRSRTTHRKSA